MIIFATQFIFNRLMAKNTSIIIKGARVNNLKNIDVEIPRNKLVVITNRYGPRRSLKHGLLPSEQVPPIRLDPPKRERPERLRIVVQRLPLALH